MYRYNLPTALAYKLYKEQWLAHRDIRKMRYGMTVLFNETYKIIGLFIIFKAFNLLNLFLFSFFILLSIRAFSGGLHFESNITCFFTTFVFFILTVVILPKIILTTAPAIILGVISFCIIYIYSPIPSSFRPIHNEKRRLSLKYLSVFFTLSWLVVLFTSIHLTSFFACGIWTIFLQGVQLLLAKKQPSEKIL